MSNHIGAEKGQIASRVLLPGDPMRAKFIAENFLEDAFCYSKVRGMYGFTGTYKGKQVSVQATGMGAPSASIYINELMKDYGCTRLIRTGTTGSISPDLKLKDLVIVHGAASDSGMFCQRFGTGMTFPPVSDFDLMCEAVQKARELGIDAKVASTFSGDFFYDDRMMEKYDLMLRYGIKCCDMECAELLTLAAYYKVQALGLLTVSDLCFEQKGCSKEEREQGFTNMMKLALETI